MKKFLLTLFTICFAIYANAQCAMCKAVAEQGANQEITKGGGINSGIIILVIFAYICLVGFLLIAFRKKIKPFLKDLKNAGK